MKQKLRAAGRRVAVRMAPSVMDAVTRTGSLEERTGRHGSEIEALRSRVAELEQEVQECRRLNRRLAEVVDVVEQVLVPAADRDEARLRRSLDSYVREM